MKRIILLTVAAIFALSLNSFSQIKVNSTGQVGINQNYPTYNLDWFGTGRFTSTWGQLIFDSSGYGGVVTIHPADDWVGCLGLSDKKFNVLYVDHVIAREVTQTSDMTLKTNIVNLKNSISKLKQLRGVRYDMKSEYFDVKDADMKEKLKKKGKNEIGFLAQELKEIFPEVVYFDPTSNLYSVSYANLVPVLVEAIKEQQTQIEELQKTINTLTK